SAVVFADALLADSANRSGRPGVLDPEDLLTLDRLAPALRDHGITAVDQPVTASDAVFNPAPAGVAP
ncbi:MAG: hypothetical protein WBP81_36500, partial [Solirubrobacteraceae bacterium]